MLFGAVLGSLASLRAISPRLDWSRKMIPKACDGEETARTTWRLLFHFGLLRFGTRIDQVTSRSRPLRLFFLYTHLDGLSTPFQVYNEQIIAGHACGLSAPYQRLASDGSQYRLPAAHHRSGSYIWRCYCFSIICCDKL